MAKHDPALDHLFTALGDPTRRAVLERLAEGPATVSDLNALVPMAMPSLMGHLRRLEEAGMIATQKDGRVRTCALVPGALGPARDWLSAQAALWDARLDRFDAFVTELAKDKPE